MSTVFKKTNLEKILIGFSVVALTLFFVTLYSISLKNRNSTLASAQNTLDRVAVAAETGAARITLSIDATLLAAADALDRLPGSISYNKKASIDILRAFSEQNFYIREVIVLDNMGNRILSSVPSNINSVNDFEKTIIHEHLSRNSTDSVLITRPSDHESERERIIHISRSVSLNDGRFNGYIAAEVELSSFNDFFQKLVSGSSINIALFDKDGAALVSEPNAVRTSEEKKYIDLLAMLEKHGAINPEIEPDFPFSSIYTETGTRTLKSIKKIPTRSLYVLAENNVNNVLTEWRGVTFILGYIFILSAIAVTSFTVILIFVLRGRRKNQLVIEDALHHLSEGFVLFDRNGRMLMCNERYRALYPGAASLIRPGVFQRDILRASALAGDFGVLETDIGQWLDAQLEVKPDFVGVLERRLASGCWIQVSQQRMSDGGHVGVHGEITGLKQQEINLRSKEDELNQTINELERSKRQLEHQADDLSRLARDLATARDRAEEASRAKSQFLANMSHELRTPLNAVIGFGELLELEVYGSLNPKQRDYIKDIRESGMHLLDIINDVLDLSKIEAGREELREQVIDLGALIDSQMSIVRPRAAEFGLTMVADIGDGLDSVLIDPLKTRQMVLNLLSNAVKFTPDGGRVLASARIEPADADEFAGWIRITIEDTGIGIKAEHLGVVREPFRQVENHLVRRFPGTGLGLAITEAQVRLHGGRMDIDSALGRGTAVTLWLPPWRAKAERPKFPVHDVLVYS